MGVLQYPNQNVLMLLRCGCMWDVVKNDFAQKVSRKNLYTRLLNHDASVRRCDVIVLDK